MIRKSVSLLLSLVMVLTLFPLGALADEVSQTQPISDGMESAVQVNQSLYTSTGLANKATLTEDMVNGKYAVQVAIGDLPNQSTVSYRLTSSDEFDISNYSQIKLWVKPGAGAQWIKFSTNGSLISSDKDLGGIFKVGQDLVSGQWNQITLDLTKTNPKIAMGKDLIVTTNDSSTWSYDEITSVYTPATTIDLSQMVNSQTQLTNGELRFKENGTGQYNTEPTIVTTNNTPQPTFSRSSFAYNSEGINADINVPRFDTGNVGSGNDYFLKFDGIDDSVNCGNGASFNVGNVVTVEGWIFPTDLSKREAIFSTRSANRAGAWQLEVGSGSGGTNRIAVSGLYTWVIESADNAIQPNKWQHIAFVRNGAGNDKLYVNGAEVAVGQSTLYNFTDNQDNKLIGSGAGAVFPGNVDKLRIWNIARSREELVQDMNSTLNGNETGLVACWEMNENSGTITYDSTSNNNDGTIIGATWKSSNQGIMVEEGTQNLLTVNQSNVETDLTGLEGASSYSQHTFTRDTTTAYQGSASGKVVSNYAGTQNIAVYTSGQRTSVTAGKTYTVSAHAKASIGATRSWQVLVFWYDSSGAVLSGQYGTTSAAQTDWARLNDYTTTAPAGAVSAFIGVRLLGVSQNEALWYDSGQLEQKSYGTSFVDTTRSPETLSIPTAGVFNKGNWSVEMGFSPTSQQAPSPQNLLWRLLIDSNNSYGLRTNTSGYLEAYTVSNGQYKPLTSNIIPQVGTGYYICFSGDGTNLRFFINGVQVGPNTPYTEPVGQLPSNMWVGSNEIGSEQADGVIDNLRISSVARTSEEIANAYTSAQPLPTDENTTYKMDFDGNLNASSNASSPVLPNGKISGISIDSSYVTTTGALSTPPAQRLLLPGVQPTKFGLSGDGNKLYYANPQDGGKVYLLDLITGAITKVSDLCPTTEDIKVDYSGNKAAFLVSGSLYLYDASAKVATLINTNIKACGVQNDGTLFYVYSDDSSQKIYRYNSTTPVPGTIVSRDKITTYPGIKAIGIPRNGNQIYFSYEDASQKIVMFEIITCYNNGYWREDILSAQDYGFDELLANSDGNILYYENGNDDELYSYELSSKSLRKLALPETSYVKKVTDDNKLIILDDMDYSLKLFNPSVDEFIDISPSDIEQYSPYDKKYVDADNTGNKIVYVSNTGLAMKYLNVQKPERYLLSFDGKNSWMSCKDGQWSVVKTGGVPEKTEFDKYGMTVDEINALDAADFNALYADGRQIMHFDVAIYMQSVDSYTTPSIRGITVSFNGGADEFAETPIEKALFTTKQQSFDSSNWRKIRKIYPIEIQPKEAETYYFIVKDEVYKTYKNNQWVDVNANILTNPETNWIDSSENSQGITQLGMTADELRAIPNTALDSLLPASNITVIYAMKVEDLATDNYSSLITIDYVEKLFEATNLTLKINYVDGTSQDYPDMTQSAVENFMEWVNQRQYNEGPIFYTIKTISDGVEKNDFINYYTIKSVSVGDSVPTP